MNTIMFPAMINEIANELSHELGTPADTLLGLACTSAFRAEYNTHR